MLAADKILFRPYVNFRRNADLVQKHLATVWFSCGVAHSLLLDLDKEPIDFDPDVYEIVGGESWTSAEISVARVTRLFGWVTFEEYAELEHISFNDVRRAAQRGELGHVCKHPKSGASIIIWPSSKQHLNLAELPELGMSEWRVHVDRASRTAVLDPEKAATRDRVRRAFLHELQKLGRAAEIYDEAGELSHRGAFLNLWAAFEIFLRETIGELIHMHPDLLAQLPDGRRASLSYQDISKATEAFSNAAALRDHIIAIEIARLEAGNQSVHGLINFMKGFFVWQEDIYEQPYMHDGARYVTSYNDLLELKEVRNALVHDNARSRDIRRRFSKVPGAGDKIEISTSYLKRADLIVAAIAYEISQEIELGAVKLRRSI